MRTRLDLHAKLVEVLGTRYAYFQPPSSVKMVYPCIVYAWSKERVKYANDSLYFHLKGYTVTIIDKNPDSEIPDRLRHAFSHCSFERSYVANNLNHWIFTIYF
jgi:hypothetical protein